ncbi:MAG: T9SS type A sorting domain-containing protein [bacterium]
MFLMFLILSWSSDVAIDTGYTSYPNQHNIVCDKNNNVHITYFNRNPTSGYDFLVWYKKYNGTSWTTREFIDRQWLTTYPCIATNRAGNDIYISFQYNNNYSNIAFRRFHNGQWDDTVTTVSSGSNFSYTPSMVCDTKGALHIVWEKDYEIHYRKFDVTLSTDTKISNSNMYAAYPTIAEFDAKVFVVWEDLRTGNFEIYLKEFVAQTWQKEIKVTTSSTASIFPSICIDSAGVLHIVWQEEQQYGGYKIFYTSYSNGSFGNTIPCVESPGEAISPSIVTKGNKCWLAWADSRDGGWEIYYKELVNGIWGEDIKLTDSSVNASNPSIAVDNNENLYALFWDTRDGVAKVYFKENISKKGTPPETENTLLASPNPFYGSTRIYSEENSVKIYDKTGTFVTEVINGVWNGKNIRGKEVLAGIYFVKSVTNKTMKVVKIR